MLPGKTYRPEELVRLAKKRWWVAAVPAAVIAAGAALYAKGLPDLYRAETTILVVPPQISDAYVRSPVTSSLDDRLQAIKPTILSRTRLEGLIEDLDLYPAERRRMPLEDVLTLMRQDVNVATTQSDAFSITYVGRDPRKVAAVTNRLATLFIDESVRSRAELAQGTDEFLESRLEDAKRRLEDNEARLRDYQERYATELPSQAESNMQQVRNAQAQMQTAADAVNRLVERRTGLDRQLASLQTASADAASAPVSDGTASRPATGTVSQQLAQARQQLATLEAEGYKAGHPDLELAKRRIRDLTAQLQALGGADSVEVLSPSERARQANIAQVKSDMAEVDRQIAAAKATQQKYADVAQAAQARVDAVPTRQAELIALNRDYSTISSIYQSLLAKKEEAQTAADLQRRQIGEQFRVLDPAQVPERPVSPNRQRMIALAGGAGLALGAALVWLFEFLDRSLKSDEEVQAMLKLPVLAVVPVMRSRKERRNRLILNVLFHTSLAAVVLVCCGVVFRVFRG
jgi:polysaccharide chain length determinant protein (PEP-CTERM system associated)